MKIIQCKDYCEAYDLCREYNHPIVVQVGNEIAKIYLSGSWKFIGRNAKGKNDVD